MRITAEDFEARAFFTLFEVVSVVGRESSTRRNVRRWLNSAGVVTTNGGGARIVTRARLESSFPELLETLRRACVMGGRRDPR